MPTFHVFSRRGCHLCEILVEELLTLVDGRAEVQLLDVDQRQEWAEKYGNDIPVVALDGTEVCRHRLDRTAILAALAGGA